MTQTSKEDILNLHASCACLKARSKARLLTQSYDAILAPSGLKITQFSPLSILLAGPASVSELAEAIRIDRTTLTRVLAPLQRKGYITIEPGSDARTRTVTLTAKGVSATKQALEFWKEAQSQFAT